MVQKFAPNPVVGYRFSLDWYTVNVVEVKQRGVNSKDAGQEYLKVLAYCKNVHSASEWLFDHVLRAHGSAAQAAEEARTGSLADMHVLMQTVADAKIHVLQAAAALQAEIKNLGLTQKELVKALGVSDTDQPQVESADAQ